MKARNIKNALCTVAVLSVIAGLWLFGSSVSASRKEEGELPSLRGKEAVEHLKRQGLYSSLNDAIESAADEIGTADPQIKLTANDGAAGDGLGHDVAISGDTAAIGAPFVDSGSDLTRGAVYVFVRGASGWTLQQKLSPAMPDNSEEFGWSVAIDGNTIFAGAPGGVPVTGGRAGGAYVFTRTLNTWTQQQKLTASDGERGDEFGFSVSISGDAAVVGTRRDSFSIVGKAYVFSRTGTSWQQQQILTASDGTASDFFGSDVRIDGGTIIVGALAALVGANQVQGAAYIFARSGASWVEQQKLVSQTGRPLDQFGTNVAISGSTVAVAECPQTSTGREGSVYVFTRSGTVWTLQQRLVSPDGAADNRFCSVSLDGENLYVGDPGKDVGANQDQGAIYHFARTGPVWNSQRRLTAADGGASDFFGRAMAVSGNTILAGVWEDDIGANADQGSAYIFECTRSENQQIIANDGEAGDWFGYSIAASGNTVVVGAKQEEAPGGSPSQGAAYIFTLSGGGWTLQQKIKSNPPVGSAEFGHSVDIDANTIVVGAWKETVGSTDTRGAAYVFVRSGTTWTQQARLLASDGAFNDQFGNSVAIDGDSIIVGAALDDTGANNTQGSAYIFVRNGSSWQQQAKLTAADGQALDEFGNAVDISGDSVLIGAYRSANNFRGHAYVFTRSGVAWTQQQKLSAADGVNNDEFGFAVTIDGNTAAVGAWRDDEGPNQDMGSVYVFNRSGTSWTQAPKILQNLFAFAQFGSAVSLDGDNLLIGQRGQLNTAYIYKRNGTAWISTEDFTPTGTGVFQFGESVAISGETVAVGAFGSTVAGNTTRGAAWVYYANCSSAPVGSAASPINRRRCKPPAPATLGTVSDAQQPAGTLTVTAQSVPQDLVLTNLANNNGTITGTVGAGCALVQTGPQTIVLQVSDGSLGVSTFNVTVNVIEQKPADFDGDGRSDVAVWRPSDRNWYILQSSNNTYSTINFGLTADRIAPGDFDGDGRTDIAVFRPSNGTWYWLNSSNGSFSAIQWGTNGDIPAAGDYDGDGKFDATVFRPGNGTWYVVRSSDAGFTIYNFGLNGDRPAPGDYDGDGRTDFAVFRPSSNVWYALQSTAGFTALQFGAAGDKPAQGDYDGDAKTDFAVYRPSAGVWFLAQSILGQTSAQWGVGEDLPSPGDFDGDGKFDLAVFRPSQGFWYVKNSSGGGFVTAHGVSGDVPVEAGYIPQ